MIYYSREKKELIIPEGMGGLVPSGDFSQGFEAGKTAQASYDSSRLVNTAITQNGTYIADYGYKQVSVNVESGGRIYTAQTIVNLNADFDGHIRKSPPRNYDGFADVDVYDNGYGEKKYTDGYQAGVAAQKSLLVQTAITQNGTYTREDGFNSVSVQIAQKKAVISGTTIELTEPTLLYSLFNQYVDNEYIDTGMIEVDGDMYFDLTDYVPAGVHNIVIYDITDFEGEYLGHNSTYEINNPQLWQKISFFHQYMNE